MRGFRKYCMCWRCWCVVVMCVVVLRVLGACVLCYIHTGIYKNQARTLVLHRPHPPHPPARQPLVQAVEGRADQTAEAADEKK